MRDIVQLSRRVIDHDLHIWCEEHSVDYGEIMVSHENTKTIVRLEKPEHYSLWALTWKGNRSYIVAEPGDPTYTSP